MADEDIQLQDGIPPSGYTFNPHNDPPFYETDGSDEPARRGAKIDTEIPIVDTGDDDEGESDGAGQE